MLCKGKNMNNDIVIKINNMSKKYNRGVIGTGSIQQDLKEWWSKVRGIDTGDVLPKDSFYALENINLEIKKGEAIGLIGKNGAGKSTLLKILSRITTPTKGEIDIYGRINSMLEVGTGFHMEMTGRENIYLNGAILGMSKSEIEAKMDSIIEFSEVGAFIDTPVKRYSSGMYVRLAFSVAIHLDSEIMVLDEILAVGDATFQQKCINKLMESVSKENKTVIYVSHNMQTVRQLCNRCICLKKGKVIYDGDVETAIDKYNDLIVESNLEQDVTNRNDLMKDKHLKMSQKQFITKIEILESLNKIFTPQDKLVVRLYCVSKSEMQNIFARFEIKTMDGFVIGSVFSEECYAVEEGENYSLIISLDLKNLTPDSYMISVVLTERGFGNAEYLIDCLPNILTFKVIDNDSRWNNKYWGVVHFDDMKLEKI